jgi:adenylate cyclase class 2
MSASESPVNHEIEVKFAVPGHQAVADALRREGGTYMGSFEQVDQFYDTPGGRLRDGGCGLRIRQCCRLDGTGGEIDTRPQVTFKGPRRTDARAKVRPEYQTHVDAPEAMEKVFEACGLVPTVVVRKRRTSYRLGGCMVELDELADIGCFVEVEGPDEPTVFKVARRLGLAGEPVGESYLAMVLRRG